MEKIAQIVGWSTSTILQIVAPYGHFTIDELRGAVETINIRKTSSGAPEPLADRLAN
jgi:hypothetical protein